MYPDAQQLAVLRADGALLLLDTCTIQKVGLVSDGSGGKKRGETVIASNEPCRVDSYRAQGGSDLSLNARLSELIITVRYNSLLDKDCQVVHGGQTYEVWDLNEDQSHQIFKTARMTRLNQT